MGNTCTPNASVLDLASAGTWRKAVATAAGAWTARPRAAEYWAREHTGTLRGHSYRLVVYRTSSLDQRNAHHFDRELTRVRATADLAGQAFTCAADAEAASRATLRGSPAPASRDSPAPSGGAGPAGRPRPTQTTTRLTVWAEWEQGKYPTGIKITAKDITALHLVADPFQGQWNYTISPQDDSVKKG